MEPFPNDIFNLADIVLRVAREDPDRISVIEPRGRQRNGKRRYSRHTYGELSAKAESVARGLRRMGIAERTPIVFMAPPGFEASVMGVALTRVGALTIWIDPAVGYRNVAERLSRVHPEAFFGIFLAHMGRLFFGWGPRRMRKLVVAGRAGFPGAISVRSLCGEAPSEPAPPDVTPEDPVSILYTTGSTGPAKPSLYRHKNFCQLFRNAHRSWRFYDDSETPVDMAVFPAFMFIPISAGGTMVVPPIDFARQGPAQVDPGALIEVINDCKVKSMFGSPVILENVAAHASSHGIAIPSLKRVIGGGAPITGRAERALLEVMNPGGTVAADYGATEAMPSTEMEARENLAGAWSLTEKGAGICVGRPLPGVELKIIDIIDGPINSIGETVELAGGKVGEILVRGKHVSPEYYLDDESTRKNKVPDADGGAWHRFGDAGYLDENGRLWVCGRVSQRVRAEGGPLFPLMCEPIFDAHPKVRRSGLVGVPGPVGDIPVLCIETEPDVRKSDWADLRSELLKMAAGSEAAGRLHEIVFKRRLPVDPRHNSKIERPELARWAARKVLK
ncbi:MAG: fatty acid CoA ligase family protein [Myxococcota bacterium]|jgi:acyl-CoA synthetase (AMP-forming)/AMP-acid ligase II